MPVNPLCHGSEYTRPLSNWTLTRVSTEVRGVRDVGLVQLLHPAQPDQPGGHPVGEAEGVAAGVLAGGQLRLDLGEELVVVVDVLGVVDLDAGLLREGVQRRVRRGLVVDVDVRRPVRPVDDLVGVGLVRPGRLGRRRCAPAGSAVPLVPQAARRGGQADGTGALHEGAAGEETADQRGRRGSAGGSRSSVLLLRGGSVGRALSASRRSCGARPCGRRRCCRT